MRDSRVRRHLDGASPVKPIAPDRPAHVGQGAEAVVHPMPLSEAAQHALTHADGTLAVELPLAALAALTLRHTGDTDLVIGLLADNLTVPRLRLSQDTSTGELCAAATEAIAAAAAIGPVDLMELRRIRDAGGLAGQAPCHGLVAVRGNGTDHRYELEIADVVVVLQVVRDRPRAALVCDAALYQPATVTRLAGQLGRLMAALAEPMAVSAVPLLDAEEREQVLHGWNDTARPVGAEHVPSLVAAFALSTPDSPAIVHRGVTTTYAELDAGANRLANHLIALGVEPGHRVGVLMARRPESLLAQLAVWRAGCAVLLLDPEAPSERLAFMLTDSAAVAVVTTRELATPPGDDRMVVLADAPATWLSTSDRSPNLPVHDEDISHIAYTSGTTGAPKAVPLRHGALRNTTHVLRTECEITAGSRGTWLCSPGFGLVQVDCFPVLAAGAVVHIADPDLAASPEDLLDWLVRNEITHTLQLTAMAERLWTLPWPAGCVLRSMRVAGERVRTWPPPGLPFTVLNVYGSTETNVVATCDLTTTAAALPDTDRAARLPPIGRPVINVRAYVLDRHREPAPLGVLGELHVSSPNLPDGYLGAAGDPDRFAVNPIEGDPYPVLYRTGDVARYWPDGVIEVVGRTDEETTIRGYRVNVGEVESVLAALPGVRHCAVLAREDIPGSRRLVAYVEPEVPLDVRQLRASLARRLPPYLRPSAWVLGPLPATARGKIDRAALPPPSHDRPDLDTPYEAPRTALQRRIAELFSEVLGVDGVGVLDEFAALGGDSFQAMRLLTRLRHDLGAELTMADLLGAPSAAGLATLVEQHRLGGHARQILPDPANRHRPFPLTAAQRRLWVAWQGAGPADLYEWTLDWLDIEQFLDVWHGLVERHDALRTVVGPDSEQVARRGGPAPELVDLTEVPAHDASARVAAGRAVLRAAPPPHALRLTVLPDNSVCVQLALPALTVDHDSAHRVLLPELATGRVLPPPPVLTFRDYAQSSVVRWSDRAVAAGPAQVPPASVVTLGGELAADVRRGLRAHCEAAAASPADALVAAMHDVLVAEDLGWLTGGREMAPLACRSVDRLTGLPDLLVGCFTTSHPVDLAGPTFAERARSVPDRLSGREPAPSAVELAVAIDEPPPGLLAADPLAAVVSSGAWSAAAVRVVFDEGAVRTHWTVPSSVDAGRVVALDERYRDQLRRYASDEAAWWDGVDHFNNSRGLRS